jgi:hypothetical protein
MDSRSETCLTVSIRCLFALCTLGSALAQTTTLELREPGAMRGAPQASLTQAGDHCAPDPGGPEGYVCGALSRDKITPSVVDQSSPLSGKELAQRTQQFLDEKLTVWCRRLNLAEWRISINMTYRSDLKPKTLGGIRWDKGKKSAVIWVLDPSDYRLPFPEMLNDMELTIVHELVHLELASLPRSEASRSSEEHAVNGIAEALLALDHKK